MSHSKSIEGNMSSSSTLIWSLKGNNRDMGVRETYHCDGGLRIEMLDERSAVEDLLEQSQLNLVWLT